MLFYSLIYKEDKNRFENKRGIMKNVLLIVCILFVAVASTACINNLAVQDLNNKAKIYADKGDYTSAIERLKSSIDLAVEEFKKVIEMKPASADSYYSLATAQNNLAVDIEQGRVRLNIDDTLYSPKAEEVNFDEKYKLSENEEKYVSELYQAAVENYQKYLELNPTATDKSDVELLIQKISEHENLAD
jgi:tetratricopeptide (TPR) repeat protein